ncbi:hypothetical protein JZ751_005833 [Albula glossodonta]|uniref:Uncharacterized protein n=1 Tax=Albula glossodonta TaxID=121402 RepID=A0A8T2P5E6_9TELE|nr:hypothetical protein JZ751_005833 [Albula glossodonta]
MSKSVRLTKAQRLQSRERERESYGFVPGSRGEDSKLPPSQRRPLLPHITQSVSTFSPFLISAHRSFIFHYINTTVTRRAISSNGRSNALSIVMICSLREQGGVSARGIRADHTAYFFPLLNPFSSLHSTASYGDKNGGSVFFLRCTPEPLSALERKGAGPKENVTAALDSERNRAALCA